METVRKSITFTSQQDEWIKIKVKRGLYTNDSEYIRDLVRKDQTSNIKLLELKNAIDEGFASGKSKNSISELIKKVDDGKL